MGHLNKSHFYNLVKNTFPHLFNKKNVLEISDGEADPYVNSLISDCFLIRFNICVLGDMESKRRRLSDYMEVRGQQFDLIILNATWGRNEFIFKHLKEITLSLKSGGLFLITCESEDSHGQTGSPTVIGNEENIWELVKNTLQASLHLHDVLSSFEIAGGANPRDFCFWGVKKEISDGNLVNNGSTPSNRGFSALKPVDIVSLSPEETTQKAMLKIDHQNEIISELMHKLEELKSHLEKLEAKNHRRLEFRMRMGLRRLKGRLTGKPVRKPRSYVPDICTTTDILDICATSEDPDIHTASDVPDIGATTDVPDIRKTWRRASPNEAVAMVILTSEHTVFIANSIQDFLKDVGISSTIIFAEPEGGFSDDLHFVIAPQTFDKFPNLYVSFQVEQSTSQHFFSKEQLQRLDASMAILDYSLKNIEFLKKNGISTKQCFYVPLSPTLNLAKTDYAADFESEFDVLFYGDANCERRRDILNSLRKNFKVKTVNNAIGYETQRMIASAQVVIIINDSNDALLAVTRINECLSLGKVIFSEKGIDQIEHQHLEQVVDFVDMGDIPGVMAAVRKYLSDEQVRTAREARIASHVNEAQTRFKFYFLRFLLAYDVIDFDQFYELAGRDVEINSDHLCLTLPEYMERKASFENDNSFKFEFFTGLRHQIGWVGCGLSYKFMLRIAQKQNLARLTICEDDVKFPESWEDRYNTIMAYLEKNQSWDNFSGFNADVHQETKILQIDDIEGESIIYIDRTVSTVFNVYNNSFFGALTEWDSNNRDETTNTIDRFMERNNTFRIAITDPFLVGHKEELHSTLWNGQNTIYNGLIKNSQATLKAKISSFRDDTQ